jgi:hypothetical protein
MIRALVLKELRENVGVAAVALALYLALVCNLTGLQFFSWVPMLPRKGDEVPFLGPSFHGHFAYITAGLALALGFRQSVTESARGTYLFLLHRPLGRDAVFLTKLAAGAVLLIACAAVPILIYGAWAATPGHHPSPFAWSMTGFDWRITLVMSLVYLGAFLSGLRPARWWATRLLPLAASGMATLVLIVIPLWWWVPGLLGVAVLDALWVTAICWVARMRDYA